MMAPQPPSTVAVPGAVTVRVRIAARPDTVFAFLQDVERFRRWMGSDSSVDAERGAVKVRYPNGDVAHGEVLAMVPAQRLVYAWGYENGQHGIATGSTRVAVELTAVDAGTMVTVRHEGLVDEQLGIHLALWRHHLAVLAGAANAQQLEPHVTVAVDAYLAARREADPERRSAFLAMAVAEDVVFRDAMGYVEGRDALHAYMEAAHRVAPGVALELSGAPIRAHDVVLFPWRMVTAEGQVVMTGHNVGELSPDGLFRSIVGFWDGASGPDTPPRAPTGA